MTKRKIALLIASLIVVAATVSGFRVAEPEKVSDEKSKQAYNTVMDVLTHKRCMNCHASEDRPRQGEDSHRHYFDMERGADNHGFRSLKCSTCHQEENNPYSGVPGAPHWQLAPASMTWEGLTRAQIAEMVLDPKRNGNRSHEDILHHMTQDKLVLWAWDPGVNADGVEREKPPHSLEDFSAAVKVWIETGAKIPAE